MVNTYGGDIDDASTSRASHGLNNSSGHEKRSGEIHVQYALPFTQPDIHEWFTFQLSEQCGVIYQRIEASEAFFHGRHCCLDTRLIAHIERERRNVSLNVEILRDVLDLVLLKVGRRY